MEKAFCKHAEVLTTNISAILGKALHTEAHIALTWLENSCLTLSMQPVLHEHALVSCTYVCLYMYRVA